jgi:RNA polymerase sigma factor (sigma-70 family)
MIKDGDEQAFELMCEKYTLLIYKYIYKFNLRYMMDDMLQEGYMVLLRSIRHFDESFNKSFTRYFMLNLSRQFQNIVTKRVSRQMIEESHNAYIFLNLTSQEQEDVFYDLYLEEIKSILPEMEYSAFFYRYIKFMNISDISLKLNLDNKKIYNMIYRARKKLRNYYKNLDN